MLGYVGYRQSFFKQRKDLNVSSPFLWRSRMVDISARMLAATFGFHVDSVCSLVAKEQMRWVDAWRRVARMTNKHPGRYRADQQLVSKSVSPDWPVVD